MKINVLDHGYVEFVEAWGHGKIVDLDTSCLRNDFECGIIEAARQSTQGSFRGWAQDARLLKYLYNHKHETPFEFAGMVIEVQAPIFVFREWHRHRTQSYNEMSARYEPLPDLYYVPTVYRVMMQQAGNKQAEGAKPIQKSSAMSFLSTLQEHYAAFQSIYKLDLEEGVPKELARLGMPVGHYSRMRASANLRNWLGFLTLRMDPAAQWEIRQFANAVGSIIAETFPKTWELFSESRRS